MNEAKKKMIIIEDCVQCPKWAKCKPSKALTATQRFVLLTGVRTSKVILKDCPLKDVPLERSTVNESI